MVRRCALTGGAAGQFRASRLTDRRRRPQRRRRAASWLFTSQGAYVSDEDIISEARAAFQLAADAEAENRRAALDDIRFARLGEQWPEQIRRERALDGRACLTINRLPAFIRQVVNDARQNKPAIAVHPVDGAAEPARTWIVDWLL